MAGPSVPQLGPAAVSAAQWTLLGVQLIVLALVVAWLARDGRLRRVMRRLGRRGAVSGEGAVEVGRTRSARLVSSGGGGSHAAVPPRRPEPAAKSTPRALRALRGGRASPGKPEPPTDAHGRAVPATLHCPGCGALLARGELATRLVTHCTGCDRRVAVRCDGERVVVTLEG